MPSNDWESPSRSTIASTFLTSTLPILIADRCTEAPLTSPPAVRMRQE